MKLTQTTLVATLCLALGHSFAIAATSTDKREPELRRICQELIDAVAPGNVAVWKKYLDDKIVHVDENGTLQTKDDLLEDLTPLPAGLSGGVVIDRFQAQFHGNVAAAAYEIQESLDYHGQMLHTRFRMSDTWLATPKGWRLIAQQVSAVLKDPPAIKLPQTQLCAFNGDYALTQDIELKVSCSPNGLTMERAGRPAVEYLPETADVFFAPGSPRSRRLFERDPAGKIVALLERREGEDIRWAKKP